MLLHQAALQFELWTGSDAPLEVMASALEGSLAQVEPPVPQQLTDRRSTQKYLIAQKAHRLAPSADGT